MFDKGVHRILFVVFTDQHMVNLRGGLISSISCVVFHGSGLDTCGLKETQVLGHDLRPLTQARAASEGLPEAQPAGGCWWMCSQPWHSPPGLLGRPVSALKETHFKDNQKNNSALFRSQQR